MAPWLLEVQSLLPNDLQSEEPRSGWLQTQDKIFWHDTDLSKLRQKINGMLIGSGVLWQHYIVTFSKMINNTTLFKESALWVNSFYKLKCPYVCLFVRHTFSLRLTVFLPPLPEVWCPNVLDFWNPWGKSNGKKWSQIWKLLLITGVKSPRRKQVFYGFFSLIVHSV